MDEHAWTGKLRERKVREFSFFPEAFTPMEKEDGLPVPPVELELGEGEAEADAKDSTPSWVKNISFTIAGVTIGGAAVYGLLGGGAVPNACPTPLVTQQSAAQSQTSAPLPISTPPSGGTPPRSTGPTAGSAASSSATSSASADPAGSSTPNADGTI